MIQLNKDNCTLVTVIENKHNLEKEALKCFTSWRQFGGELKDIPILALCITRHKITPRLKTHLSNLDVTYVEKFVQPIEYESGFFNMPIGCKMLENIAETEYIIYVDLDMFLITQIPLVYNNDLVIEKYDFSINKQSEWLKSKEKINKYFNSQYDYINTEFIITKRENKIFDKWFNVFNNLRKDLQNKNYDFDIAILEEYAFEQAVNNVDKISMSNIAFRLDNDCIQTNHENFYFHTNHLKSNMNIIIDEKDKSFQNFKPININIELNSKCLASCVFCNRSAIDDDVLHINKFKEYVQKLIDFGIYEFELTPQNGEILTIENIHEYIYYLENHPDVKSYFFYTSLITYLNGKEEYYKSIFQNIKKGFVYFSCYWAKNDKDGSEFIALTKTNQLLFNNNIELFNIMIDNINSSRMKIIDRTDQTISKIQLCLNNKTLKKAIIDKKILFGKDGTYLYNIKYHRENYKMIHKFCEQFATCITVLANGEVSFCNFSNLPHRILCDVNNLDFSKVFTIDRLNIECGKCLNYEPAENKNIKYVNGPIPYSSFYQNLLDAQRNHNEQ